MAQITFTTSLGSDAEGRARLSHYRKIALQRYPIVYKRTGRRSSNLSKLITVTMDRETGFIFKSKARTK